MKSGSQRQCAVMKDNDEAFGWGGKKERNKSLMRFFLSFLFTQLKEVL
jgi:hypothetical protein